MLELERDTRRRQNLEMLRLRQEMDQTRRRISSRESSTTIAGDDAVGNHEDVDKTIGDIWFTEAKQTTTSPRASKQQQEAQKDALSERPRRKLIPSPWKHGQQLDVLA